MPGRKLVEHSLTENSIRTGPSEVCGPNTKSSYGNRFPIRFSPNYTVYNTLCTTLTLHYQCMCMRWRVDLSDGPDRVRERLHTGGWVVESVGLVVFGTG
jgi:hypothetical protein